ncbi:MAG: hypothetical protein R3313_00555 [Candidatus Saccharimonadales bacterium]|nr:hypothetical protein [Candidatus Saccharimonadales bacterium]
MSTVIANLLVAVIVSVLLWSLLFRRHLWIALILLPFRSLRASWRWTQTTNRFERILNRAQVWNFTLQQRERASFTAGLIWGTVAICIMVLINPSTTGWTWLANTAIYMVLVLWLGYVEDNLIDYLHDENGLAWVGAFIPTTLFLLPVRGGNLFWESLLFVLSIPVNFYVMNLGIPLAREWIHQQRQSGESVRQSATGRYRDFLLGIFLVLTTVAAIGLIIVAVTSLWFNGLIWLVGFCQIALLKWGANKMDRGQEYDRLIRVIAYLTTLSGVTQASVTGEINPGLGILLFVGTYLVTMYTLNALAIKKMYDEPAHH